MVDSATFWYQTEAYTLLLNYAVMSVVTSVEHGLLGCTCGDSTMASNFTVTTSLGEKKWTLIYVGPCMEVHKHSTVSV